MCEDDAEQFSLRWNNFCTNLTSGFHTLWQEEDLVDVTLAADGKFIRAHKIVLSVCSPYFMQLFKVNPCQHPIVILKDVSYSELNGLLHFMYKGEVNVYQEELANFLKTAELLQIKGLTSSDSQVESKDESSKDANDPKFPPPEIKSKQTSGTTVNATITKKRKLAEENRVRSGSSVPPVPTLEPIDFLENDSSDTVHIHNTLASLFEVDSTRHVTNKPGQRLIANFSTSLDPLDAAQATFRVTARGRLQLVQNNFVYHCNRQKDNKIFWKCAEYNRTGCRGRCISIGWSVTVTHALHNHHPSWTDTTHDDSKIITDLAEFSRAFVPRDQEIQNLAG